VDNVPPCGYILGDEGGGAVMGRKLLSAFLKRDLPEYLCDKLRYECGLSKEIILERVYRQPFPNRFLAQHAQFLEIYKSEAAIQAIITNSFEEFFDRNVLKYPQCRVVPIHFIGSIAFHFAEFLRPVAESRKLTIGKIIKSPIDDIAMYHLL
jgi:N-acetylglucosamine kinase-like BadF-type ATPase